MVNATYDWDIPSERFLGDYASSFVHSFKREKITQFAYVKKQTAQFLEERGSGFSYKINLTHTEENPAMDLHYFRCSDGAEGNIPCWGWNWAMHPVCVTTRTRPHAM